MIRKIEVLLKDPNLRENWNKKRFKMLNDKIDVTNFLFWFIINYPSSLDKIKAQGVEIFDNWKL